MKALWPRSLKGQLLFAVALALLLAQAFSAVLIYRAQAGRREAALIHTAAFRLLTATRGEAARLHRRRDFGPRMQFDRPRSLRIEQADHSPLRAGDRRDRSAEAELGRILRDQDFDAGKIVVIHRSVFGDELTRRRMLRWQNIPGPHPRKNFDQVMVVGVERPQTGKWIVARVLMPPGEGALLLTLIGQTLLIYVVVVGAMAFILRRITRPLAALTGRLEQFASTRSADGQMEPEGPDDVRRLIVAHNAMEARISALLDEKDVMLGAIGHDLKTPLAALRVRIESVEDETERARMAATIEDIVRTLDDILSLARVGRPADVPERSELSALVASVAEEYEDMGAAVAFGESERIVLPVRPTWLRRALRNLIDNALRYGRAARVSLAREGDRAVIRIEDDGPGIADAEIGRMMDPFTRGEPSRNTTTGGAGLGLALARAIAEQHGGSLTLTNRHAADGQVDGLTATLRVPLS